MVTQQEIDAVNANPNNQTITNPDLVPTIQDTLMKQSGMISSANTGIEAAIQGAIGQVQKATTATGQKIESQYGREAGYLAESQAQQITAARERGVGINTSDIAYKSMAAEADKNLKDLEMRKNELLLANDAAGASKIADLMLQTSKMKIDAMQQSFQNLLAMGGFGLQAQQEKRAAQAQTFQEKMAETTVGLQYGVTRKPGESWDSYIGRVGVGANTKQQAELAKINSEIRLTNAKINKVARGDYNMNNAGDLEIMKLLAVNDPALYKQMLAKDKTLVKAFPGAVELEAKKVESSTYERLKLGDSFEVIQAEQAQQGVLEAPSATRAALKAFDKYKAEIEARPKAKGITIPDISKGAVKTGKETAKDIRYFLTGREEGSIFPLPGLK